jgi:uncharacterized protein
LDARDLTFRWFDQDSAFSSLFDRTRCDCSVEQEEQMETARILLSGASGMIGTTLVRTLAERQVPFSKLVRHETTVGGTAIPWNPAIQGRIAQLAALEGFTAAIHLSGANLAGHSWTQSYKQELVVSRVQTTKVLSEALAGLQQKPRVLICASAVGYYGNRGDEILTEEAAQGKGFLSDLCSDWEKATVPAEAAGIRVVHIRLGVVLCPGAGALGRMLPIFRCGLGGRLGAGTQWMSWISLPDVISAIFFLIQNPLLSGPVNLVAPNPVTNADFTRVLGHVLGRPAFLPVPSSVLQLIFGDMARETMLSSTRAIPARLQAAGFQFQQEGIEEGLQNALR